MGIVRFVRKARRESPRAPGGEVSLQTPPEIPRATPGNLMTKLLPLVMVAAMIGMVALMFTSGMAASPMSLLFPMMMLVSTRWRAPSRNMGNFASGQSCSHSAT